MWVFYYLFSYLDILRLNHLYLGGAKLLIMTFLYYVPLQIAMDTFAGANMIAIFKDICVISYGPYWFITTYLLFYMLSPMVNAYLEKITPRQRIYMLSVLAFINIWIGRITEGQPFFMEGKNVINFLFLYLIGNTVRYYKPFWEKIKCRYVIFAFAIYNIFVVGAYYLNMDNVIGKIIMRFCYGYNSPGLITNALLLFVVFLKFKFKSAKINFISSSVFAVYLITDQTFVRNNILKHLVEQTYRLYESTYVSMILLVCFTLLIMSVCICIDKLLTPVWNISNKILKSRV